MKIDIITHKRENDKYERSPFDEAICSIAEGNNVKIACPYLSIKYLKSIANKACSWSLLTDLYTWLESCNSDDRKRVCNFLHNNLNQVHHIKGLHAKVIVNDTKAFLGSANFTTNGLEKNEEVSVLINNGEQVKKLHEWFETLWKESDPPDMKEVERKCKEFNKIKKPSNPSPFSQSSKYKKPKAYIKNFQSVDLKPDKSNLWKALVNTVQKAPDKEWIDGFFDLVEELLEFTGLSKDDPRLVISLTKTKYIAVIINQRCVLTAMSKDRSAMGFIMSQDYQLPDNLSKNIIPFKGDSFSFVPKGSEKAQTTPRWLAFKVISIDQLPNEMKRIWRQLVLAELKHGIRSSYRKHHKEMLYNLATNKMLRKKLLDDAFTWREEPILNAVRDEFKRLIPENCTMGKIIDNRYCKVKAKEWPTPDVHYEFVYAPVSSEIFIEIHIENESKQNKNQFKRFFERLKEPFQKIEKDLPEIEGYKLEYFEKRREPHRKKATPSLSINLGAQLSAKKAAEIMQTLINETRDKIRDDLKKGNVE